MDALFVTGRTGSVKEEAEIGELLKGCEADQQPGFVLALMVEAAVLARIDATPTVDELVRSAIAQVRKDWKANRRPTRPPG